MKQLSRTFRVALMTAFLMSAAEGSVGGTANTKSPEQIAEEKAAADAAAKAAKAEAKAKADAEKAKAKEEKAAAKKVADEEKAKAKAEADAKKAEEKAKAAEAKRLAAEEKAKQREANAVAKVKVPLVSQRGVTQPKEGTKTRRVWDIADALSKEKGAPVAIAELQPVAAKEGLNDATIRTQYARWKGFHGVFGSVPKAAAPAAETQAASNESTEQAAA
jgi:hypothetical protein